ncbi:hypothetical protein D3C72_1917250 [compost metagenome]
MAHRDTVIHCDGIELFRHAACGFDLLGDQFTEIAQMHVARHKLGEGVNHGDNRLTEVSVGHPGCAPQRAGTGHIAAVGGGGRTILRHALLTPVYLISGTVRAVPK